MAELSNNFNLFFFIMKAINFNPPKLNFYFFSWFNINTSLYLILLQETFQSVYDYMLYFKLFFINHWFVFIDLIHHFVHLPNY